jgi:hypothetical protein
MNSKLTRQGSRIPETTVSDVGSFIQREILLLLLLKENAGTKEKASHYKRVRRKPERGFEVSHTRAEQLGVDSASRGLSCHISAFLKIHPLK